MAACGKRGAPTARPILSRTWAFECHSEPPAFGSLASGGQLARNLSLRQVSGIASKRKPPPQNHILNPMAETPVEAESARGQPPVHRIVLDAPSWLPTEKFPRNLII